MRFDQRLKAAIQNQERIFEASGCSVPVHASDTVQSLVARWVSARLEQLTAGRYLAFHG